MKRRGRRNLRALLVRLECGCLTKIETGRYRVEQATAAVILMHYRAGRWCPKHRGMCSITKYLGVVAWNNGRVSKRMKRTNLENFERQAMTGDKDATLKVVSALRKYRELMNRVLDSPHVDPPDDIMDAWEAETKRIEACDE